MSEPFPKTLFISIACLLLYGFTLQKVNPDLLPPSAQPKSERQAQETLPKSHDPMWAVLGKTKIHENYTTGRFSAVIPPEVKALVGKQVTVSGFMLPVEPTQKFKHFIISKRTPTCPFCPPGEPNEVADVWVEKPMGWDENLVKITGTFELMNNPELGMFFKITKARVD